MALAVPPFCVGRWAIGGPGEIGRNLVKSVGSLQKDSVAIDRIGLKLLETIDGIRVEMPPAAADTQADGIGELVGSDGFQLEPVAAAGRRVDAECEEMVVDRPLRERTH